VPLPNCGPNKLKTDLSLTKTQAKCIRTLDLKAGMAMACFDVTIKNEGPGPFNGPIQFSDNPTVPGGSLGASGGATCTLNGGGFDVLVTVTVTNQGNSAAHGPIVVVDKPQNGNVLAYDTPNCVGGPGYTCTYPGDLAPHATIVFRVKARLMPSRGESDSCQVV